ncbi:MAG: O-methyltransferase [Cenarchaeum sp. SB0661_bin_35]|nr:O-methyltransferase [Cenarchaeum sp. SB0661_bin_35]
MFTNFCPAVYAKAVSFWKNRHGLTRHKTSIRQTTLLYGVDRHVYITLKELDEASRLENSRAVTVPVGDLMSAITWDTGILFNILLRGMGAKNVLEIGTSTGFSTMWMAEAMNDGRVMTIEADSNKRRRAQTNFKRAGLEGRIEILPGNAQDVLKEMSLNSEYNSFFDFVLIDADKENIPLYFDMVLPMLRSGGFIATDNMTHPKKFAHLMDKFAGAVRQNPAVRTVTIPIGNGEELTVKL